jgi:parallel beta-helix repeat protein
MSMGRLLRVSAALACTAAFSVLVAFAPQAVASHVQCGEAITQDTRLDSDLVACPSDGIVISADDITLDLNGHTIDGVGATSSAGVREANQSGVTIENGTIRDFASAVVIAGDSEHGVGHVIRQLTISGGGIFMFGFPTENLIERNSVFGTGYGILVSDGTSNMIRRNSLVGNSVAGIFVGGGSGNEIARNTGFQNGVGIALGDTGFNSVNRNVVTENSIGHTASRLCREQSHRAERRAAQL